MLNTPLQQYLVVTGNYWAFTLTDGALRMLVVLYFHQLGYQPLEIAMLFLFYEFFGVVTNLVGGWLGARLGLNRTMNVGLFLQIASLAMLLVPHEWLTVIWVMAAQALSGIAKDLNKMSAKSTIKLLVPSNASGALYKWVAILTGSKNTLKGVGFFMGGLLLTLLGFTGAVAAMAIGLLVVWCASLVLLNKDMGKTKNKPKFSEILSKSRAINYLSAARLFLFGARDVWFVVALPVFLATMLDWPHHWVGTFMASWVIGYGFVQAFAPKITGASKNGSTANTPDNKTAFIWALPLAVIPIAIATALYSFDVNTASGLQNITYVLVVGLMVFGALFAINSSVHSFLIVHYADSDGVSLDVGFYYMANAMGRLIGTLLSGWVFQEYGLEACLLISTGFILIAAILAAYIPERSH
jgi:MFS family permease